MQELKILLLIQHREILSQRDRVHLIFVAFKERPKGIGFATLTALDEFLVGFFQHHGQAVFSLSLDAGSPGFLPGLFVRK